jgi:hypothetical protein
MATEDKLCYKLDKLTVLRTFKVPKRSLLAYLSYSFSSDPKGLTKTASRIATRIMRKYPNIFIIVPHTAVDVTVYGPPKASCEGYKDGGFACQLEYTILEKIDMFIQGVPDDPKVSMGCIWEHAYVLHLNKIRKKQIIVVTPEELLGE